MRKMFACVFVHDGHDDDHDFVCGTMLADCALADCMVEWHATARKRL